MRKLFLGMMIAGLIPFLSCTDSYKELLVIDTKVKQIIQNGQPLAYSFDSEGRLTRRTAPEGIGSYTYSAARVTEKLLNTSGLQTDELVYELNAGGLAVKTYKADSAWLFTTYEYNSNRQVSREIFTGSNNGDIETVYYYAADGDLDSAVVREAGVRLIKRVFEFDDSKPNTITAEHFGIRFFGKETPHLITRQTEFNYATGVNSIDQYAYETDDRQRVTKVTRTVPGTTINETVTYSYN